MAAGPEGQGQEIGVSLRRVFTQNKDLPVWRHAVRGLSIRAFGKTVYCSGSVRRLRIKICGSCPRREEHDSSAVSGPNWIEINGRIERQPGQTLPGEVPNPDVLLLVANVDRHARAIGSNARIVIGPRRRRE